MSYRPDVDGLRAVAIVAVVMYHAWPASVPGGFAGVDVFFVISGFLITRLVLAPGFSYATFYRRRIRRLFPALLVVLAATLAVGQWLLPPDGFRDLLRHAVGGGLFFANFVSYAGDGYFSGASDLKPLVHLWSLGVEEQFYLLWPVLIRVATARGQGMRFTALAAAASLALFLWLGEADPRAAFYLAPPRFWELLAGALLVGVSWRGRSASIASALGLISIAASMVLLDGELEFPGARMLLPVCGAALVIVAPESSPGSRLLSSRVFVWLGLISYPLYLWHWPLLALLRNFERVPSPLAIALAVVAAVILADITRRLVERPLSMLRLAPVSAGLAAVMAALVGLVSIAYAADPGERREMTNAACTSRYPYHAPSLWFCTLSKDAPATVLLLGDSHANHLYSGVAQALPEESVLSIGACAPTPGLVYPAGDGRADTCFNESFAAQEAWLNEHIVTLPTLKRVIVSAMWRPFDAAGNEIDYGSGNVVSTFGPVEGTPLASYVAALERQVERIGNLPVTLVLDTPRRGVPVPEQRRRQAAFRQAVAALAARHPNVRIFDPMPVLCGESWCRWSLLRDANHLSRAGSTAVAEAMLGAP